jgi:hypothetical protein
MKKRILHFNVVLDVCDLKVFWKFLKKNNIFKVLIISRLKYFLFTYLKVLIFYILL